MNKSGFTQKNPKEYINDGGHSCPPVCLTFRTQGVVRRRSASEPAAQRKELTQITVHLQRCSSQHVDQSVCVCVCYNWVQRHQSQAGIKKKKKLFKREKKEPFHQDNSCKTVLVKTDFFFKLNFRFMINGCRIKYSAVFFKKSFIM